MRIDIAYLCRLFKRFDNQSPSKYLMRLKMNPAAQRLQSPIISMKEVAFEFDFSDPFHFFRASKRIFGMPQAPLETYANKVHKMTLSVIIENMLLAFFFLKHHCYSDIVTCEYCN